ncbi:MAG: VOC family protein [Cyanobacteria bacterium P01_F01_bin.150]
MVRHSLPIHKDVEQRHRELTQQGLAVTPIQVMGESAAFYAQDPSGNWFEYLFDPMPTSLTTKSVLKRRAGARRPPRSKGFGNP